MTTQVNTSSAGSDAASFDAARETRKLGVAAGVLLPALAGAVLARWTPRGPLTTFEALSSMVICLAVGLAAGWLTRTRWAMLAAPLAFAVAFEVMRPPVDGPTVDGVHATTYGIFALVVGRGFHALISLLPMALGASIGAALARRHLQWPDSKVPGVAARAGRVLRSGVALVTALALAAVAVGIAIPSRTDSTPPGGVAELTTIDRGSYDLSMMTRGDDRDAPVLLFLAGGPGGSELGAMRRHLPELERHFVVATLDQRGTGKSYPALDAGPDMTLASAVDDVLAATDVLRDRFDATGVLLVGQSWGSILGVLAATEAPERFTGIVGVGQMVGPLATDQVFYEDTLAWARDTDRDALVEELERIGPPPYKEMLDYETALSYEHEVYPYDHSANSEGEGGFSENFLVEEYSLLEKVHLLGAFMDTFAVMYPLIQDVDFRETVHSLEVPSFFVQGGHEAPGRAEPFAEWYADLDAPSKDMTVLATSGHRPMFEQPAEFVAYLTATVLPAIDDRVD